MISLRDATADDHAAIVALNSAEQHQTSVMDRLRLTELDELACYHRVAVGGQQIVGFLLAMNDSAPYANDNLNWFKERYSGFFYIDRIVIDGTFSGQGIGRLLYQDLSAVAQREALTALVCEYNLRPPNPASKAFHQRFGFVEVGTQELRDGAKRVSMQRLGL